MSFQIMQDEDGEYRLSLLTNNDLRSLFNVMQAIASVDGIDETAERRSMFYKMASFLRAAESNRSLNLQRMANFSFCVLRLAEMVPALEQELGKEFLDAFKGEYAELSSKGFVGR